MLDLNTFYKLEESEKQQVNVKMIYVDMTDDLIAGILLSQIIYWNLPSKEGKSKLRVTYKGRKGIAKGRSDWWEEIRISEKRYDRSIKILKELELVVVKNTMFNGKKTPVIMLNEDIFIKKYEEKLNKSTVLPKGKNRNCPKVKTENDEKVKPLTETTTEITTDNTLNNYRVQETCTRLPFSDIMSNSYLTGSKKCVGNKIHILLRFFEYYKRKTGYDKHFDINKDKWIELDEQLDFILEFYKDSNLLNFIDYIEELIVEYIKLGSKNNYYSLQGFLNRKRLLYIMHRLEYIDTEEIFDIDGEFNEFID